MRLLIRYLVCSLGVHVAKQENGSFRLDKSRTGCGGCLGVVLLAGTVWLGVSVVTGDDNEATGADPVSEPTAILSAPAEPSVPTAQVPWEDYDASVKERIDSMGSAADCSGLQTEFDTADGNNEATMNRSGHNNADLMDYIDEWLVIAGCYE